MTKDEEIAVLREEVKTLRSAWRALVIEIYLGGARPGSPSPPSPPQSQEQGPATPYDARISAGTSK